MLISKNPEVDAVIEKANADNRGVDQGSKSVSLAADGGDEAVDYWAWEVAKKTIA